MRNRLAAFRDLAPLVLLLLVMVGAGAREPRFFDPTSLNSILLWIPLLAVVAMGQMLVIVTRGIDVSVGSIVGLSAISAGIVFRDYPSIPIWGGLLVAVGVGLLAGMTNAALIVGLRVPPIIATLGSLSAFRGLTFLVSGGRQIDGNQLPANLIGLSLNGPVKTGGLVLPWLLILALGVTFVTGVLVASTRLGRDVFALGSHPEAARLRGVSVTRTTFFVYAFTGAMAGLAGLMYASRYGFVNPGSAGNGMELSVIAAVVIGGTKVTGGAGSVLGVLLGCLLLGSINVALAVLGISATWQLLAYGAVILAAILIDQSIRRAQEAR